MILASKSKQREKLMKMLFNDFKIISFDTDEIFDENLDIYENIKNISYEKALAAYKNINIINDYILGVDTVVYFDGNILLKPSSYEDAFNMIKSYKNKEQKVVSGICLLKVEEKGITQVKKDYVVSNIKFQNLTDTKIKNWLDLGLYKYCSGGFMIEKVEEEFAMEIVGSYSNIIGLPLEKLKQFSNELYINTLDTDIQNLELIKKYMLN